MTAGLAIYDTMQVSGAKHNTMSVNSKLFRNRLRGCYQHPHVSVGVI